MLRIDMNIIKLRDYIHSSILLYERVVREKKKKKKTDTDSIFPIEMDVTVTAAG